MISVGLFATGEYGAGWNGVDRFAALDDAGKAEWIQKVGVGYDGVRGAFYGDTSQLFAQLINCAAVIVVGVVVSFVCFKLSALIAPIRVSRETELEGLDGPEMGALGYPDFELKGTSLDA